MRLFIPLCRLFRCSHSQKRLVMENLCTYSPLHPPHLINNTLIYYLHFKVFLHGNVKQAEKKRLIVRPLSVFSITTPTMDHLSVKLGTLCYLCHCKEMKTTLLWENKNCAFLVTAVPCRCKTNYSEQGIYMACQDQKIFPALTSGAFNTNPGFIWKKNAVI